MIHTVINPGQIMLVRETSLLFEEISPALAFYGVV